MADPAASERAYRDFEAAREERRARLRERRARLRAERERPPARTIRVPLVSGGTVLGQILLVFTALAVFGFLAWLAFRELQARRPLAAAPTPELARRSTGAAAPPPLWMLDPGDPDAHAERGHYEAAILALLVKALRKVGWAPLGRDNALTAREVLARLTHRDPRHPHLGAIVAVAESVRFAGAPATRDQYLALKARLSELEAAA